MNVDTGKYYEGEEVEKAMERGENLVELPCKPAPDCPKCRGVGTLRSWGTPWKYGACPKCYPDHEKKAVSFKQRLLRVGKSNPNFQGMTHGQTRKD
mgnify:CR=1 FL=1